MLDRVHRVLLLVFRRLPRRARLWVVHRLAPSYTVGAICVVERPDDRILLVRHSYRDHWGLPGGLAQRGEDIRACARRETAEEVGLEVELVGEPNVVVAPDARRVDVVFRARPADAGAADRLVSGSPEILEARWFRPDALPDLQHEAAGALAVLARGRTGHPG